MENKGGNIIYVPAFVVYKDFENCHSEALAEESQNRLYYCSE